MNVQAIMDRLHGIFRPIHAKWEEWKPEELYLWNKTHSLTALKLLEADIQKIGHFFANADDIGARSEYALVAECIAELRMLYSSVNNTKRLEQELDVIEKTLQAV